MNCFPSEASITICIKVNLHIKGEKKSDHRGERNELLAQYMIKKIEERNMEGYYAATKEEALKKALELIPKGSTVSKGGTLSASEIGLVKALREGNYDFRPFDSSTKEAAKESKNFCMNADYFLCSANAITQDGIIVNIDGRANRVAAICYGPENVLMIVGMNKVTADLDSAIKRARNEASPINAMRFKKTPCTKTGYCINCKSPDTICCQFLVTRFSRDKGRIKLILVGEELGF